MMRTNSSIFYFAIIFLLIFETRTQLSDESEFLVNRSETGLFHVPKDLSLKTTILDISQNYISELHTSDILSLSKLRILVVSHNRIQYLDISVFKFNQKLEYLDLSHNELGKISCHPTVNLKHLDLSFNAFDHLPVCKEFVNMSQLEFLGLSATRLQKSSVLLIAPLHINKVLLVLGDTYGEKEDPESLHNLNTESLHIVFPRRKEFSFTLDVSVSTAVSLELSNIKCVLDDNGCSYFQDVLSKLQKNSRLSNLTLNNIETTWNFFIMILQLVWHTSIEYFSISNVKLQGYPDLRYFDYSNTSLKALSIHHVVSDAFSLPQSYIYEILSNMNIQNFTVSDTHMVHMVCPSQISPFLYLDFSNNLLTDMVFKNCGNLVKLETLNLRMNQLKELVSIVNMTKKMKSLQQLDISQNSLSYDENEGNCSWTGSLLNLNMSSNILTESVFRCLPPKVRKLDLHNNKIQTVPKDVIHLKSLQELNLAFNFLTDLPGCSHFRKLSILNVEMNLILSPSLDFSQSCQEVKTLNARRNPFRCTCELRDFIRLEKYSEGMMIGWSDSYICEYPLNLKGTRLKDVHLPELSCNTALLIVTIVVIMLVLGMAVTFCCFYFEPPWYLRMLGQWTQTLQRIRKTSQEQLKRNVWFHVFISYSEHDSTWVKHELIPNLEKEEKLICLHEGHFDPGKSITENIMNLLEKSCKSIFVLSPNFVQSEWCHYELYFAHHSLFHENSDYVMFILLEPIPLYCIPTRYP
ncbi:unnamed protein product [Gulo gulo]|uniref:Toll-like receptor 1 n=1 Tax=Gulo gulo TaxID=48420 RepID=A0A9X9LV37_GULGU|nr:unnamed protein product [Gulo gulo]